MAHVASQPQSSGMSVASLVARLGATALRVSRRQSPEDGPSSVTMAFPEVAPFEVRCEFRFVEDDDGEQRWWLVGGPSLVEAPNMQPAEITPKLLHVLVDNRRHYRRLASLLIDMRLPAAIDERNAMLVANGHEKGERLDDLALLDLLRADEERRARGEPMTRWAADRGYTRSQMYRQLKTARLQYPDES